MEAEIHHDEISQKHLKQRRRGYEAGRGSTQQRTSLFRRAKAMAFDKKMTPRAENKTSGQMLNPLEEVVFLLLAFFNIRPKRIIEAGDLVARISPASHFVQPRIYRSSNAILHI